MRASILKVYSGMCVKEAIHAPCAAIIGRLQKGKIYIYKSVDFNAIYHIRGNLVRDVSTFVFVEPYSAYVLSFV